MDATAAVNLALVALNAVLGLIAQIKSQGSLTDDAILAAAQKQAAGNDAAYASMVAALKANGTITS